MISDITLGQYFPGNSIIHNLDARVKLLTLTAFIVFIFLTSNYFSLAFITLAILLVIAFSGIPLKMYLKSMKMIIFIILFTSVINLFYGTGEPLWQWGIIKITESGINNALFVVIRIFDLILISSSLTFTTKPTDLTDALEYLMKPLSIFHIEVHEIAMIMTIALRFIPTLLEQTEKIMNAQKARGADMESGSLINKVKALIPVLIPLFVSSFRRAYDLAVAMECRCYHGGEGRTKLKVLKLSHRDLIAGVYSLAVLSGIILFNIFLPEVVR